MHVKKGNFNNVKIKKGAIITGTIAEPSSPSVRFTAFELPTITRMPKGK